MARLHRSEAGAEQDATQVTAAMRIEYLPKNREDG
ncbi:MAG: hypothetical protein J07HX64_00007 [halophilic archaeon J07HX64]|nr:MAG: hypothetical protein J07HX64_00007 [halophilic archaeon J07HX64]